MTIFASSCYACKVGLHDECFKPHLNDDDDLKCCCSAAKEGPEIINLNSVGRPLKDPDDITDLISTGRKRAAKIAPIFSGMVCEWAYLKYAGGGVIPILGCNGNKIREQGSDAEYIQGDRHHGPDKNVLNNTPGINLHRICAVCHHRWHAENDRYYPGTRPSADEPWLPIGDVLPHDTLTKWSQEEYEENEKLWLLDKAER